MTTTTLPTIPSALIRVALKDLALCEADDNYKISMGRWHGPSVTNNVCVVCFAGSVMAQSLGADPEGISHPLDFPRATRNSMYALNMFRVGYIKQGLEYLEYREVMLDRDIVDYRADKELFVQQMNKLASDFEGLGI